MTATSGFGKRATTSSRPYLAGQYLPFPKERESIALSAFGEQTKFVVPADRADKFMMQWQELPAVTREIVSVYASRVFDDARKDGCVTVSHCPQDICEAIHEKLVGDLIRLQKYQQEQLDAQRAERDAAHEAGENARGPRTDYWHCAGVWCKSLFMATFLRCSCRMTEALCGGSVPSGLEDAERESRITFTATVTASDKDAKFGF